MIVKDYETRLKNLKLINQLGKLLEEKLDESIKRLKGFSRRNLITPLDHSPKKVRDFPQGLCKNCFDPISELKRKDSDYCSKACKNADTKSKKKIVENLKERDPVVLFGCAVIKNTLKVIELDAPAEIRMELQATVSTLEKYIKHDESA